MWARVKSLLRGTSIYRGGNEEGRGGQDGCMCRANTKHSPEFGTMLGQRLRRWPNIVPVLGECLVFAGVQCGRAGNDNKVQCEQNRLRS